MVKYKQMVGTKRRLKSERVRSLKEMTCCFTGHRSIPAEHYAKVDARLEKELINLIKLGYRFFCAGGALGFDTMAALKVLSLKELYEKIELILILPCETQAKHWSKADIDIYEDIKARCDQLIYTSAEYTRGCMLKRNRRLVNNSSVCIAYLTEAKGGTAYTVEYARKKNVTVINTAE